MMTEKEYQLAIKKYLGVKNDNNTTIHQWLLLKQEMTTLQKNSCIKRYIEILTKLNIGVFQIDDNLLRILKQYGIRTTKPSEVYYYMGQRRIAKDISQNLVEYIDIETRKSQIARDSNLFEKHNFVLNSDRDNPSWKEFEELENWYYQTLLTSGSLEEAAIKVKKKCRNNIIAN